MSEDGEKKGRVEARVADEEGVGKRFFRKSLRNANINYRSGWYFVTMQVEHNKSICKMEQS